MRAAPRRLPKKPRQSSGRITSDDEAAGLIQQALFYRARARRLSELADAISHPEAIGALRAYAAELEQRARELEARAATLGARNPEECD